LKNLLDTTQKNLKQWLKFVKIQVSNFSYILDGFCVDHGDPSADEESIDRLWLVVRSLKNP